MLARRDRGQRTGAERDLAHRGAAGEVHRRRRIWPPAGDIALPVDVQIVDAAGRLLCPQWFEHASGQRQRGGDVAQVGQIQCRGLDLQAAQRIACVERPPDGDVAHAARRASRGGRRLDPGACQFGYRWRLGGQVQRLPEQRVDAENVLAARVALMCGQRLKAAQLQRLQILADLQIELLPGQPRLAAREHAVGKLHRAVGGQRAALGGGQHGHIALHGSQLQRIDLPGRLAMPVAPVAGAGQQVVAEIGVEFDGAVEQRGRGAAGLQPVARRAAAQLQPHIAQRHFGQLLLLVEPADGALLKIDVALGEQLVEEDAVAAGVRAKLHAGDGEDALRIAPYQQVGLGSVQGGKGHLHAQQRAPGQPRLDVLYREGAAARGVVRVDALGAECRVPALPIGLKRADVHRGVQCAGRLALHPFACHARARPQDEAHRQHADDGQDGQRGGRLPEHPPQLAPDRGAENSADARADPAGEPYQPCPGRGPAHPACGQGAGVSTIGLRRFWGLGRARHDADYPIFRRRRHIWSPGGALAERQAVGKHTRCPRSLWPLPASHAFQREWMLPPMLDGFA